MLCPFFVCKIFAFKSTLVLIYKPDLQKNVLSKYRALLLFICTYKSKIRCIEAESTSLICLRGKNVRK